MSVVKIKNLNGNVIFSYDEDDERWIWGDYDFSGINLEDADLEGIVWQYIKLRKANLKKADFYMSILCGSDLSESDCEEAEFQGASLQEVNFTKANLKNANFSRNGLGGSTDICGANFTEANLDGAKFDGAVYDAKTIFPEHFNAEQNGLIHVNTSVK
jgi:uncharacterized protein YjbI with pentapeptide repeats